MIIADAIITNIVYRLIFGVRISITPTNISQSIPKITNRMITDVFILAANLVILSFTAKIKKCDSCRTFFFLDGFISIILNQRLQLSFIMTDRKKNNRNIWISIGAVVLIILLIVWLTTADFFGDNDVAALITPLLPR